MVPYPRARDFVALNALLEERCRERQNKTLRGNTTSIGERLAADQAAFQELPPTPFDACDKRPGRVTSQALVRYKNTDYSVPVAYAHRDVMVKAYVDDVVITSGAEEIARHRRSYDAGDFCLQPAALSAPVGTEGQGARPSSPLQEWDTAGRVRDAAPVAGSPAEPEEPVRRRQAGIRAGLASDRDLPLGRCPRRGAGRLAARRDQL